VIRIELLAPSNLSAFEALFEASASSCFCRYWHFEGTKNEWLGRCAHAADRNRAEQAALVQAEDRRARGLLALEARTAVGWLKLAPRDSVPKLRRLPVYKSLDLGPDEGVHSVTCVLVHPEHRGRGIARALIKAAVEYARACGGRAIEAYPRRTREPIHAEEAWMGPESLFVEADFVPVHDESPYPVLRKTLDAR
jgi:GNAT superfamily N-acetyltransferase